MGKKTRKEREEKRESFASKRGRAKRKNVLIAGGVLAAVASIVGVSAFNFTQIDTVDTPPGAGVLNDEHEHASILVRIFGDRLDFSSPAFQIQSRWIHFESQDGTTIHRHSSGVTMGYLFETLDMEISEECFIAPQLPIVEHCANDLYDLKYYLNGEQVPGIADYVLEDGDRFLVTYGDETEEVIDRYLLELEAQPILA